MTELFCGPCIDGAAHERCSGISSLFKLEARCAAGGHDHHSFHIDTVLEDGGVYATCACGLISSRIRKPGEVLPLIGLPFVEGRRLAIGDVIRAAHSEDARTLRFEAAKPGRLVFRTEDGGTEVLYPDSPWVQYRRVR